jgi:hypothetical protein
MKQTTNSETIREKHACPKPESKQDQGTGNNRFDSKTQKTTGPTGSSGTPGSAGTSDPKNRNTKNRIWSLADYDATPTLDLIINTLTIPKTIQCAAIVNTMHERFAHFILEELKEWGLPYGVLDGQTFTIKITFSNERPEEE